MIKKGLFYYIKIGGKFMYYYLMGNWLFMINRYDKKYKNSRWFKNGKWPFMSTGWAWVVINNRECRRLHVNIGARYPVSAQCIIGSAPERVHFHPDDLHNLQCRGGYFQAYGNIFIGKGVYIAPNVGIITANHDIANLDEHVAAKDVIIGDRSWIGMNAVILPGVVLGENTIVGAGAVVTHSFEHGNCVIAGNPAKVIKEI